MRTLRLRWSGREHRGRNLGLRPLWGGAEIRRRSPDRHGAASLLQDLIEPSDGSADVVRHWALADQDRALALLHAAEWGPTLECQAPCRHCSAAFEFDLRLDEIFEASAEDTTETDDAGVFRTEAGFALRPPRLADLEVAADASSLRRVCALERPPGTGDVETDAAIAAAFPTAVDRLDVACPECGAAQSVAFSLASHLVALLTRDRAFLLREVHAIADRYGWPLSEILSLEREDRRALTSLITGIQRPSMPRRAA